MPQSPDLKELYNELAYAVLDGSLTRLAVAYDLGWSTQHKLTRRCKRQRGRGNYELTSEGKSYYIVTGVVGVGKTVAEFVEILK